MIGAVCCRVLEKEVHSVLQQAGVEHRMYVLDWGLHIYPDKLSKEVESGVQTLEQEVDAVLLGFGRCQMRDKLSRAFQVPLAFPEGEDCIGVLLGQERYERELLNEAGTWFLTPGWAELGLEFVFRELQVSHFANKGKDPLSMARYMLQDYSRVLLINSGVCSNEQLLRQGREIADALELPLEQTNGSLSSLQTALEEVLDKVND